MLYQAKNYESLLDMKGFGKALLERHFELYREHVVATNELLAIVSSFSKDESPRSPERAELRRRLGWEWNGMRLHELYFENLGGNGDVKDHVVEELLEDHFGTAPGWEAELRAIGSSRGVGWAVLYYDPRERRLLNSWIDEHHGNHLAGAVPLLVLDLWEHACPADYGSDRDAYMDAFFANVDWRAVRSRLDAASQDVLAMSRG